MKHYIRYVAIAIAVIVIGSKSMAQQAGDLGSAATGNWSDVSSWVVCESNGRWDDASPAASLPTTTDKVYIRDGHTITINQNVSITHLIVGEGVSGILTFDAVTGRSVTVSGNITVAAGGSFIVFQPLTPTGDVTATSNVVANVSSTAGVVALWNISGTGIASGSTISSFDASTITMSLAATVTGITVPLTIKPTLTNTLSIGGNLTNNGTFDMSLGSTTTVCNVTFNNTTGNQTINGTAPVMTRFRGITVAKSAVANKVLASIDITQAGNGLFVFTSGAWEQTAGTFTVTSGSVTVAAGTALIISGTANWYQYVNNNLTIAGTFTMSTSGTVTIGNGNNKFDCAAATANVTLQSGTMNVFGKVALGGGGIFNLTGTNINVDPQDITSAVAGDYIFRITTASTTFNWNAGTITIVDPNVNVGAQVEFNTSPVLNVSGTAKLVLGNGVSTSASGSGGFRINSSGLIQDLTINTGTVPSNVSSNFTVKGTLTLTTGTLTVGAFTLTLQNPIAGTSSNFSAGSTSSISIGGTAAGIIIPSSITALNNLTVNNSNGIALSGNLTVGGRLTLTNGNLALNGNNLTVGTGSTILTTTGNTTSASTTILSVASTAGVAVGMNIVGTGIPTGATVSSFVANTSITISSAATATNTGVTLSIGPTGYLSYTAGYITGTGNFKRWFGTTAISGTYGLFPMGVGVNNRSLSIGGSPTTGGTVSVAYNDASTVTTPFSPSFTENSQTFVNRYGASWGVLVADGFVGSSLTLAINGDGIPGINNTTDLTVSGVTAAAPGTYAMTTGTTANAVVNRTDLTESTIPTTYYIASTNASSLPVELQSFIAKTRCGSVELHWSTATEVNNAGFEVEKNVTGIWSKIGFVEGAGTTNTQKTYLFADAGAKGKVSYRLKQIDRDGKFSYSNVVEAVVALTAADFMLSQNYPNPFNPSTSFSFGVPTAEMVNVSVYNMLGQKVATLFNGIAAPNELYSLTFNGGGLASGTYIYALRSASRNEIKKMLLTK